MVPHIAKLKVNFSFFTPLSLQDFYRQVLAHTDAAFSTSGLYKTTKKKGKKTNKQMLSVFICITLYANACDFNPMNIFEFGLQRKHFCNYIFITAVDHITVNIRDIFHSSHVNMKSQINTCVINEINSFFIPTQ